MSLDHGAAYKQEMTDDGEWGDYWVYEDRLIYVHKRHVAIPLDATPDGDLAAVRPPRRCPIAALTYDEMRPGCYEPKARVEDLAARGGRRLARVPDVPALLRADVHGGHRPRPRARVRAGLQRLDDRGLVRRLRRPPHPAVPHPAVGRRPRGRRDAAQRRARAPGRSASARSPPTSACRASTPATGTRSSPRAEEPPRPRCACTSGRRRRCRRRRPTRPPSTAIMLSCNNSMASLADFLFSGVLVRFPELKLSYSEGQIGWIPYALERADNTWEYHSTWTNAKETIPEPPSTYYRGRDLRLLHQRRARAAQHRRGGRGQRLLRDRLPAHRHHVAVRPARRSRG